MLPISKSNKESWPFLLDHLDHWHLRMGMDGGTLLENTGNATEYYVAQPGRIINRLIDPCEDLYLRSDLDKKTDVFLFALSL